MVDPSTVPSKGGCKMAKFIDLARRDNRYKEELYRKVLPFLRKKANWISIKYGVNFEDSMATMNYLFLIALKKFNGKGSFLGFLKSYINWKISAHFGKRKENLPETQKEYRFYLRQPDLTYFDESQINIKDE